MVHFFDMQQENKSKRRPRGSESVVNERKRLKISGSEYKNCKGKVVPAKKEPSHDVSKILLLYRLYDSNL